ncbi:SEC23-interacting protein-like isoform X2 [Nylanderia fulva]|uniref:SEC23-interacting protein-like isoform X2 n=1 Tax=Nylanderia fulva TaxID=613905 RepID=UPI0010FB9FDA|nr:SEC23-interacting protein-like isoform X2 [Nylanderia fulva]
MNNASRKVKNPLLSAAGPGFSFDNYAENTLLVPVRPASVELRDDAELDNFIGQKPANIQSQSPSKAQENSPTDASFQSKESKDTVNQPTKSGYFTSILSSLPNLSLSSSNTDTGSQINQTPENTSSRVIHEPNSYISSQGHHGSQSEIPGFLGINPQDPRNTNLLGFAAFGPTDTVSTSPQPAVPPSLPQSGYTPVSYRLGNQRRLKYAPPPDLTSNNAKSNPTAQTFFPTQNVSAPPTILNPFKSEGSVQGNNSSVQQTSSLPEQLPKFEQLSGNNSLRSSFQSNSVATETAYKSSVTSTTQNKFSDNSSASTPSQFVSSLSRPIPAQILEPVTPQNTPANISLPGFPYVNRDILPTSSLDREVAAFRNPNQLNLSSEFSRNSISETTTESAYKPSSISEETKATFTPVSAAKVTEKLENLLAEQKEDSSCVTTSENLSNIDEISSNVTTELTKSFESQSETPLATNEFIYESYKAKLNDVQEKTAQPGNDTWSDVFLGQEPAAESVICSKVHTADNIPNVTDIQTAEVNTHLPQYFQLQSTSMPSSAFYADKPADQKSNLNYVAPQLLLLPPTVYNTPKPTEQSTSVFFESTKPDKFLNFSQEKNINPSLSQPNLLTLPVNETIVATNNLQQVQEKSAFSSTAIDSTAYSPFWNADQSSQSQVLNTTSNQPIYTAPDPGLSVAPVLYNPAQFANKLATQQALSHTYDQHSSQQQSYQINPSLYKNTSRLQQSYAAHEDNTAYSSPAISMVMPIPEPTGSATLSPIQMSVNAPINRTTPDTVPPSFQNLAAGSSDKHMQYRSVYHHWFYRKEVENKTLWLPFSMQDSLKLEEVHNSTDITPETIVATEGGRYDVDILRRQRTPVYWTGASTEVRRCSWFFKGSTESRYVPYSESTAAKLEEEYKQACLANNWNRRVDLNNGEYVVFHSATVQVHYLQPTSPNLAGSWGNSAGSSSKPRVVKRGVDEFNIDEGEPEKVDHLLFLVHGIGSVCDLKFRTVEEVVDEFRSISLQLVQSHYRTASEQGIVNRIEVLPISWHTTLHSEDTGIDKKLQSITLESIPKLRHFTNDTLLDILFYTSPVYCQTIMRTVGSEINRLHFLFKERNPTFDGDIYLGGHSLGSLILFDLLCHQKPIKKKEEEKEEEEEEKNDDNTGSDKNGENDNVAPIKQMPAPVLRRNLSRKISYVVTGAAGTGQPFIHYPQLNFHPRAFFALGSPIGMFVTVRGIDTLGENFILPTCPAFFNIFHPFDPVAYRVESLINPEAHKFRPMLIPHHKGRKRMHLELKETMARVGADLKQKLIDSVKHTWNSFYQLALFHKPDNQTLEREIDKVVEEQLQQQPVVPEQHNNDDGGANLKIGKLNGGRRIDYVLQEAPFEYINEYIFALTSHICYWESEDTMLLILKEIYGCRGIQTDAQLPQQTMSIERVSPSPSLNLAVALSNNESNVGTSVMGIDPTVPISGRPVGPPPKTGFVSKS